MLTGNPIGNHRDQVAVGQKPFAQAAILCPTALLIDDPALPDAARELVLAEHRPDASISAISTSKTRRPRLIGRSLTKIRKREGFRMPARRERSTQYRGRRRKASDERTRGKAVNAWRLWGFGVGATVAVDGFAKIAES